MLQDGEAVPLIETDVAVEVSELLQTDKSVNFGVQSNKGKLCVEIISI